MVLSPNFQLSQYQHSFTFNLTLHLPNQYYDRKINGYSFL